MRKILDPIGIGVYIVVMATILLSLPIPIGYFSILSLLVILWVLFSIYDN